MEYEVWNFRAVGTGTIQTKHDNNKSNETLNYYWFTILTLAQKKEKDERK